MRDQYGSSYPSGPGFGLGIQLTPVVKKLVFANLGAFVLFSVIFSRQFGLVVDWLALSSWGVLHGRIWQLGTYLFLHGGFLHLLFNMFYLVMFGSLVERALGSRTFLRYYLITGMGAGLAWVLLRLGSNVPTLGASGAIYAVLLAFGMLYPNATVLLFFFIPVRAKYLVAGLIGLEVLYLWSNTQDGVAHLIHLAGAAIGFFYIRYGMRGASSTRRSGRSGSPLGALVERYRRWRMRKRLSVIDYRELLKFDDEERDRPGGKDNRS